MGKIQIRQRHEKDDAEVRELAESLACKLEREYQLQTKWQGDQVTFKRSGLSGAMTLSPGAVDIELKTGMMMSAFSGTIERELKKALAEKLA